MLDIVYEFFTLAGLGENPSNMLELIPYLLKFFVALALCLSVFKVITHISGFFFNWRWLK